MQRVVIVGGPGSGKTTLARRAARALSAVHVELDALWWQPGWVHREPAEFVDAVREVLSSTPRWVVDGNYVHEIAESVWPLADTLVWLDLRRGLGFRRAVVRSVRRLVTRQELWNGNRQTLDVLGPRSLWRLWSRWPSYPERIRLLLDSGVAPDLTVVRLVSPAAVRRWLDGIARVEHHWVHDGRTTTFTWLGAADAPATVARVYAIAMTGDGRILLVGGGSGGDLDDETWWLPGGGVEDGESPEDALRRELLEEAGATTRDVELLGYQRVDDPLDGTFVIAHHWARVEMPATFEPQHEVTRSVLVPPERFLDNLFWSADPTAARLLALALAADAVH